MQFIEKMDQKKPESQILEGMLEKLSDNFFIGFQPKFWRLSKQLQTIQYRNINQNIFLEKNKFLLKEIDVMEGETDTTFQLRTSMRNYTLRATDPQEKNMWMSTIIKTKKGIALRRSTGTKMKPSGTVVTQRTLPSLSYNLNNPESAHKKPKHNLDDQSVSLIKSPEKKLEKKKKNKLIQNNQILSLIAEQEKVNLDQEISHNSKNNNNKKTQDLISPKSQMKSKTRQRKPSLKKPSYPQEIKKQQSKTKILPNLQTIKQSHPTQTLHSQLQILQTLPNCEYFTKLPEHFILNNIWIQTLKCKSKESFFNVFSAQMQQNKFILFSVKSLFPQTECHQDNLIPNMLPSWAQIDTFYKIISKNGKISAQKIFEVEDILEVVEDDNQICLRINIGQQILQYFCKTKGEKTNFKNILMISKLNAREATIIYSGSQRKSHKHKREHGPNKGQGNNHKKICKKNYDKLINLNEINIDKFNKQLSLMMEYIFPQTPSSEYSQIQQLIQSLRELEIYLRQMFQIMENKLQKKHHVIHSVLDYAHEELKIMIKITWDSLQGRLKAGEILLILGGMSKYYQLIKQYRVDQEFFEGMKELSKVYIRETWKNFQTIIVNIVGHDKEEKVQRISQNFQDPPQTSGITDLFRFIYEVYEIALKPWSHKLHIHNVNKLMQKALKSYITELKETIDEQVINPKQLAAISNGYFRISQMTEQFYNQKFANVLKQHTKQYYDRIIRQYRELSLIIIGKIATNCQGAIRRYFASCRFSAITNLQELYELIKSESHEIAKYLHLVFVRKYYDKILETMKIQLIQCLMNNQIPNKKNTKATNNTSTINRVTSKLKMFVNQMVELLNSFIIVDKYTQKHQCQIQQIIQLLTTNKSEQILSKIKMASEPWKNMYISILSLRGDYYQGSKLQQEILSYSQNDNMTLRSHSKSIIKNKSNLRKVSEDLMGSLSKDYLPENGYNQSLQQKQKSDYDNSSIHNLNQNSIQNELRLISQGHLHKAKLNKKIYQKLYFRLKKSTLYIFADQSSECALNSISIDKVQEIISKPNKETFDMVYVSLNRTKKVHLKAQTTQMRDRWVQSLELQLKKLKNEEIFIKRTGKQQNQPSNSKKKKQFIIDYEELETGQNYFSYH